MHRSLKSWIALLCILFVVSCADSTPETQSDTEFNLAGQITDSDGAAVPGVAVTLEGAKPDRATTDRKGNFSFAKLPAGSYIVTPTLMDMTFSPEQKRFTVKNSGSNSIRFSAARRNTVPAATFSISGQILDISNAPIPDATVVLGGASQDTTTTDASGNYTFSGLLSGTYTISAADMPGYGFAQTSQTVNLGQVSVTRINCIGVPRPPTPTPATLSISGTVTDAASGVSGVTITLSGARSMTTTTDAAGAYSFALLPSGIYGVIPSKTGLVFTPLGRSITLTTAAMTQQDFTATPATTTTPTYSLSGLVATSSGTPIVGATVALEGPSTGSMLTGTNGRYSFSGLANGSYAVTPTLVDYTFLPATRTVAINNANAVDSNFAGTPPAAPTFNVSGRVLNSVGAALSNVTLTMSGAASASAVSDVSGNYTFSNLLAGSYVFTPSLAGYLFTPSDQTIAVTNANISRIDFTGATPTFSLSGRVLLDTGVGVGNVSVALVGASTSSGTTDNNGAYRFNNVPNGAYTVTPSLTDYTFAPDMQPVTINNTDQTLASFIATPPPAPTYTISGRILDDAVPAAPIVGATVTLNGAASMTAMTSASGNYSFAGLADGTYSITAAFADYTLAPATLPVTLRGTNVTNQNFVGTAPAAPPPTTYSISGRVTNNSGAALSGVQVNLSGLASKAFTTDTTGNYSFTRLVNGGYTVTPTLAGYTWDNASRSVTLSGADMANQNFSGTPPPPPTFSISGRIVDDMAVALGNVTVTLGGAITRTATTSSTGDFSFTGLADGAYTLTPTLTGYTFAQTARNVTVNGADMANQNFVGTPVPPPTFTVSGQITLNGSTTGVSGVNVALNSTPGKSAVTSTTGAYTLSGVTDGAYTLTASLTGYTFTPAPLNITVAGANLTARNFSATPPAVTTFSISGHIADKDAAPAGNVTVALSGGAVSKSAVTDGNGDYTFAGMANGAYTVTPSLTGYLFSPTSLSVTVSGANATAAGIVATPPAAGARNYTLFVTAGTLTISGGGGAAIPAWSYTDAAGTPKFPGPTLTANEGDTVNIMVTNNHTLNHNLVIQGIATDAAPITPGTTKLITFVASKAGTYLYSDTLNNNINRSMGLYGALIVGPAGGGNMAWTGGPAFTFARTWVTSDIDKPRWSDIAGLGGTVNTAAYKPNYFILNGMGGSAAMEDRVGTAIDGTVGQTALVRIVNAGQFRQSFHFHANHVQIISINGVRQAAPYKLADVVTVPPMQTMELIFVLNQPGTYPMHNHTAQMETANGFYANGVMTKIYIK